MDLGTRLKHLRIEKGITQLELAKMAECSNQTIALYEQNKNLKRIKTINKLCHIFNVTADYLINGVPFDCSETITVNEMQLILKYRALSAYYKSLIDHILDIGENFNIHIE